MSDKPGTNLDESRKKCMLVVLNIFGGKGDGGGSDSKIMCIHYNQYAKRISFYIHKHI